MQPEMRLEDCSASAAAPVAVQARWKPATKIAFRFFFAYILLYSAYVPLHVLPFPPFRQISALHDRLSSRSVHLMSQRVLHLTHDFSTDYLNASGDSKDTTFIWVEALCDLVLAMVATVIWSLLDRRRSNYQWLHKWLVVYLRFVLAATMIPYGMLKLLPVQFQPLSLAKLLQTYGDSSPAGLMWTYMGYSRAYSMFGGATELLAGVLLVVPQLATLGALVCLAVMTNVFVLNLSYDVTVKLGSMHLLLMTGFILLPDAGRMLDFFVRHRTTRLTPMQPLFNRRPWLERAAFAVQIIFGLMLLTYNFHRAYQKTEMLESGKNIPLRGIWSVDQFQFDAQVRPPLLSDQLRWRRLVIDSAHDAVVQQMTGDLQYFPAQVNPQTRVLAISRGGTVIGAFHYNDSVPGLLLLSGIMDHHPVDIRLHREDESKFLLNSRGFHWIQDSAVYQ
ncbi:MAG TPA: hypothetical protein VL240_13660 [Candidatus Binatia bacterium]|nr:hypothetical protein [Candidatus Binatia bacterium]